MTKKHNKAEKHRRQEVLATHYVFCHTKLIASMVAFV